MANYVAILESQEGTSTFDVHVPFAACRLCGAVYQSPHDRHISDSTSIALSWEERRKWTYAHAKEHDLVEHLALEQSGEAVTPIARERLKELGIDMPENTPVASSSERI